MNTAEIVERDPRRDRRAMVLQFLVLAEIRAECLNLKSGVAYFAKRGSLLEIQLDFVMASCGRESSGTPCSN